MSKGKGAAKGAVPAVVEVTDGAKFGTVRVGTTEHPVSMLINLNCPVDIMLDNVKRLLAKKVDALIQDIKNAPKPVEAAQTAGTDGETPPLPENEELNKLQEIKKNMTNPNYFVDLCDKTSPLPICKDVSVPSLPPPSLPPSSLAVCLHIYLSIYLSVCLSFCMSVSCRSFFHLIIIYADLLLPTACTESKKTRLRQRAESQFSV
jgi:hypothetical protein